MEENNNLALQPLTEYQLTDKEKLLLEILLNPEYRTKTVSDICKIAGCSRPTYYDAFKKPGFVAIYEQKTKELIKQSIGPVINTFVREALRGSFQHGKVILEMAGLYSEKFEVEHDIKMTPEERKERLKQFLQGKIIDVPYQVIPSQQPIDKESTENDTD